MEKIKVSIIIPVYNAAEFLKKCLDSAKNQTLDSIEILCIDDGSTDVSLDILKEYASSDSRFKIFSQNNLGAGSARNLGIQNANGDYIVFLDADDWIELDMCELLYNHAINLSTDLVLFDNIWHFEDSVSECIHNSSEDLQYGYDEEIFNFYKIKDEVFNGYFGVIWDKFYKTSFLRENNITFPDYKIYNDVEFHIKSLILAKKISYFPKIFYHYQRFGQNSLQTNFVGKKESIIFCDVLVGIRDFLIGQNLMGEFRILFLNYVFRHFRTKINEIEDEYKNEYFLKFKDFFKTLLLEPIDFENIFYYNYPIYIHIINSENYGEFKAKSEHFNIDLFRNDIRSNEDKLIKKTDLKDFKNITEKDINNYILKSEEEYMNILEEMVMEKNQITANLNKKILNLERDNEFLKRKIINRLHMNMIKYFKKE